MRPGWCSSICGEVGSESEQPELVAPPASLLGGVTGDLDHHGGFDGDQVDRSTPARSHRTQDPGADLSHGARPRVHARLWLRPAVPRRCVASLTTMEAPLPGTG